MTTETEDRLAHAKANAAAWYETIKEHVTDLRLAESGGDDRATDAVRELIQEGPLSVLVRDGWRSPFSPAEDGAEEFEILLTTGGPALRIYGALGKHDRPIEAELQIQDWGTQWTKWVPGPYDEEYRGTLLVYAQCFYFGE